MGRAFPGDSGTHGQGQEEIDAYTLAQKLRANNVGIADLDGNIEGFYNDHKDLINSVLNSPDAPREVIKYVIYHELLHRDVPVGGGSYVVKNNDAGEACNFWPIHTKWDDGLEQDICYGFTETKTSKSGKIQDLHIEKIEGCEHKIHYPDYQYSIICPPWFDMIFYHNDFFEIIPDVIQGFALLQRLFLRVQAKVVTKIYDVKPLFSKWAPFKTLEHDPALFSNVEVNVGGYEVIWNDDLDLSCDELFENGVTVKTPFANKLLADKSAVIQNGREMSAMLFDTADLEKERDELLQEIQVIADMVQKCIYENAHVALDQESYQKKYDDLTARYEAKKKKLLESTEKISDLQSQKGNVEDFLKAFEKTPDTLTEFSLDAFTGLVDYLTVYSENDIRVTFRNGTVIKA